MRIGRPLLKLPVRFCGETLAREISALPSEAWMAHPQRYDGNTSVPLVSPGGEMIHRTYGPMAPTEWLGRCPYILEIMQALNATWGRSRLMGLEAGAEVPDHVDVHYYWRTHLRIHVPVITNPQVGFTCDDKTMHLAAGECWLLDSFYRHSVDNRGSETRIHLVLDTVGNAELWDLIQAAASEGIKEKFVAPGTAPKRALQFEQINSPSIMSPWEMKSHVAYVMGWTDDQPGLDRIALMLDRFLMAWGGTWACYGTSDEGLPQYLRHLAEISAALERLPGPPVTMRNGWQLLHALKSFVIGNAILPAKIKELQAAAAASREPQHRMTA